MSSSSFSLDTSGKAESRSSPIFPTAPTSPVNWLTLRKLLRVGVHQQLRSGRSTVWQETDGNEVHSLVQIDLLKWCLVCPFCTWSIAASYIPHVGLPFASPPYWYEKWYNPNQVSLLETSICLSVFCPLLVYITPVTLLLLSMWVCPCGISVCIFCILFCEG